MNYLLDTNVVSEPIRPKPNKAVSRWLKSVPEFSLFLSVLTIGEIRKGIEKLGGKRKERLESWFDETLCPFYSGRILPIDFGVAERWGSLTSASSAAGRTLSAIDSLLAATALHHELTIVTRNDSDFRLTNLSVINPWK